MRGGAAERRGARAAVVESTEKAGRFGPEFTYTDIKSITSIPGRRQRPACQRLRELPFGVNAAWQYPNRQAWASKGYTANRSPVENVKRLLRTIGFFSVSAAMQPTAFRFLLTMREDISRDAGCPAVGEQPWSPARRIMKPALFMLRPHLVMRICTT
ncbi:hypothetical protein NDU88_002053 [Pleurodeles waltl]|uniref:Uncharacterized protein n=1 Tax=Pleurodeles waltl TaxID=8319 RepID=A0AAV7P5S1_PLEWA|nr:hypothetical protein NDU88_002053 [Pleurodeles waltl]